jgi:predicted amidohydrolase
MAKIAAVSMEVACDTQANVAKFEKYIKEAASQNVDLIVFPECSLQGLPIGLTSIEAPKAFKLHEVAEQIPNGENVQKVISLAKENDIYVVWSMVEQDQERFDVLYNTCVLVGPEGYIGKYRKVHQALAERLYLYPGNGEYPVFDMEFGKVGFMICYDGGFPEISRILALKGAELILCPSAFPIRDKDMWDTYFGTRSLENGCFVGGLNRVGLESDDKTGEMFGDNKIYNPRGKLVAEAPLNEEALLVATLDLEDVGRYRENEVVYLRDRRPETYELLSKLY